jgi:Tfp pilus assembly protein PilF
MKASRRAWVLLSASLLVAGVLIIMTRTQVRYWHDSLSLYEHTLSATKNNYLIHNNYGELLRKSGHADEALQHFRRAVEVNPGFAKAYGNIGVILGDKGLYKEAAAEFERSLRINANSAMMHNYYGIMLAEQGLYDKAIEQFKEAMRPGRHFAGVLRNLCNAATMAGKPDEALKVIQSWQKKMPDNAELRYWEQQLLRQSPPLTVRQSSPLTEQGTK